MLKDKSEKKILLKKDMSEPVLTYQTRGSGHASQWEY